MTWATAREWITRSYKILLHCYVSAGINKIRGSDLTGRAEVEENV